MKPETRNPELYRIILALILVATAVFTVPGSAITITDDFGTPVTLDAAPARIVSLSPSATEILAALGLSDRIVGITDVCDYPPEIGNKTRIGGYSAVSIEKVAAVRPDVVIASDLTPKESVARLREIGLSVVVAAPRNIEGVMREIRVLGEITGTGTRADNLVTSLSDRIAAAQPALPFSDRPTVAHVVWCKPLYVSGNTTMQNDVIVHAGGVNAFSDRSGWSTVSLEEFLQTDPDIIIVNGGGGMDSSEKDVILETFLSLPQYASLSAVKSGHVYAVDADIISRPGPRIADATEEVSRIIRTVNEERNALLPAVGPDTGAKIPGFTSGAAALGILALVLVAGKRRPCGDD